MLLHSGAQPTAVAVLVERSRFRRLADMEEAFLCFSCHQYGEIMRKMYEHGVNMVMACPADAAN